MGEIPVGNITFEQKSSPIPNPSTLAVSHDTALIVAQLNIIAMRLNEVNKRLDKLMGRNY